MAVVPKAMALVDLLQKPNFVLMVGVVLVVEASAAAGGVEIAEAVPITCVRVGHGIGPLLSR